MNDRIIEEHDDCFIVTLTNPGYIVIRIPREPGEDYDSAVARHYKPIEYHPCGLPKKLYGIDLVIDDSVKFYPDDMIKLGTFGQLQKAMDEIYLAAAKLKAEKRKRREERREARKNK